MRQIELLAPAKDFDAAKAAVLCGADAVYIGSGKFSARQAAGNSIETIRKVVDFAHLYYVKVYAALNTILYDDELSQAEQLIHQLYDIGIDGLIIQDMGLLELDLPPIPIIASTQMHNDSLEKVRFLEGVGFSRVILARELTIEQIAQIRRHSNIELECFVHGALCVCQSGQCYLSYVLGGRSGNRGQCAQPCRKLWTLEDDKGNVVAKDKYLLSIKDLNLSCRLEQLIDAGVTSFKIEGRLKDAEYVANVVGYYREKIDAILKKKKLCKSSSGKIKLNFVPNLSKTFKRGYTEYGINGTGEDIGSIDTPKSLGEFIGTIAQVGDGFFTVHTSKTLNNADGICCFGKDGILDGTLINRVDGNKIYPQKMHGISAGKKLYRNYDHNFIKQLKNPAERKINAEITLSDSDNGIELSAHDEDGNIAKFRTVLEKIPAKQQKQAYLTIAAHLKKSGNTIFECDIAKIKTKEAYFFSISAINNLRRIILDNLLKVRLENRPFEKNMLKQNNTPYPLKKLKYLNNVLNEKAKAFYARHGVEEIEQAVETNISMNGKKVMTTKYCILNQLGLCNKTQNIDASFYLINEHNDRFRIEFKCGQCGMDIYLA